MDTLETLGSTEFAMTRALIRIDSISAATTVPDTIFRFASAVGYVNACADSRVFLSVGTINTSGMISSDGSHQVPAASIF